MSQSGDAQKDGSAPVMFVFAGPNGSGKSSINAQVLKNPALGFLGEYINADDIAKSMESQIPDYQTRNIKAAELAESRRVTGCSYFPCKLVRFAKKVLSKTTTCEYLNFRRAVLCVQIGAL